MNDLGIVIDTPHTGERTTLDAAAHSRAPIAASHTVCRALRDHPRGKTDEQMRAIADKGGFIGITCVPHFLREGGGTIVDLLDHVEHAIKVAGITCVPHFLREGGGTIVDLLDHVEHAIKVAGIDHVGIGTDTGYVAPPPEEPAMLPLPRSRQQWWSWWLPGTLGGGNDEASSGSIAWVAWPYFTVGLLMRGYSEEDVAKVVGLNALTLFEEVERTATVHVRGA